MVLLDALRRLIDSCIDFDDDEESLLEGFRRTNPKPEDFLPPYDPVVAACLGKYLSSFVKKSNLIVCYSFQP